MNSKEPSHASNQIRPDITLTAQQLRCLSLSQRERWQNMWTTGQFSKLTGVPKRTIQHWSQEATRSKKGGKSGGAGILSSQINPENGYRSFNVESLIEVLMINLAKDAGCSQEEIKQLMQEQPTVMGSVVQERITRLTAQRQQLDKKIHLTRMIALIHAARTQTSTSDNKPESPLAVDLQRLILEELLDSLAENAPDQLTSEINPNVSEEGGGFNTIVAHWHAKDSATSELTQAAIAHWHEQLARMFATFPSEVFANVVARWLEKGYSAILLELYFGEGFTEYLINAVKAYAKR